MTSKWLISCYCIVLFNEKKCRIIVSLDEYDEYCSNIRTSAKDKIKHTSGLY